MADQLYRDMLRKRVSRENELPEQRKKCQTSDRESKVKKRASESVKKCELRLAKENEQKRKKRAINKELILETIDNRSNEQEITTEKQRTLPPSVENESYPNSEPQSRENETLEQSKRRRARDCESKMRKRVNETNEQCKDRLTREREQKRKVRAVHKGLNLNSSIECSNYENNSIEPDDKTTPKKFSFENNMDPGDVPKELQGLTEIEEMLIVQIFPVISVYCLRGG
ncbi:20867_t:CDS:2, partial [Gigaspora margarita]